MDRRNLDERYYITECIPENTTITFLELDSLIKYAQTLCKDLKFEFWDFPNFSHHKGTIYITKKSKYNIQNLISIFFHETTHFFRSYNSHANLWFRYKFIDYADFEEWIAIHNEYRYGNKLTKYGKFNPYYNLCYKVLLKDISEREKKEEIYQILKCKWYSRKKSELYYYRFYKYCDFWWRNLFLKDLIYWNGYKNVKRILANNPDDYEKLMAWQIWLKEFNDNIISCSQNFNTNEFFNSMIKELKNILK